MGQAPRHTNATVCDDDDDDDDDDAADDDDDDDDDQWVRNRGTPTPLYECFIFSKCYL